MDKNYHATQSGILPQIAAIAIPLVSRFFPEKSNTAECIWTHVNAAFWFDRHVF
jgi:hypothetical protein